MTPALIDHESREQIVQHANDEAIQKLKSLAKNLIPPKIKVSFSVSENDFQLTLPKLLAESFENLIFTGIKGTGVLKKILLGSVVLKVIENIQNIIDRENTSITFFYLAKPNEKSKNIEKQLIDLTTLFADRYNTTFAIYEGSNPFEDIKKVINNRIEEILIVQKGSRLLSDQLFRRFLINELVYEGQTPLIILP